MPGERLEDANRRYHEETERLFRSKGAHVFLGAVGGLALAVAVLIESSRNQQVPHSALLVVAGIVFGGIAGLDLHATRTWRYFGRHTFAVRFILACSAGGAAVGIAGVLLGIVDHARVWQYSLGGAGLGLLLLVWAKLEKLRS